MTPPPRTLRQLLQSWAFIALGVLIAAHLVPGIHYNSMATLAAVVILLSLLNIFLKPLLLLFTLPFIVLTLGIGILLINAVLFLLVGWLIPGFEVPGFGSAFLGGVVVSLTNVLLTSLLTTRRSNFQVNVSRDPRNPNLGKRRDKDKDDDDIIDI